jgi:hypothetical protein
LASASSGFFKAGAEQPPEAFTNPLGDKDLALARFRPGVHVLERLPASHAGCLRQIRLRQAEQDHKRGEGDSLQRTDERAALTAETPD